MGDLEKSLLPTHLGEKWVTKWYNDYYNMPLFVGDEEAIKPKELNKHIIPIIIERIDYIIERWSIGVHEPYRISELLNGMVKKYNGLLYEKNDEIMEIDIFVEDTGDKPFLFGIGNSKVFNQYIYNNHPELFI